MSVVRRLSDKHYLIGYLSIAGCSNAEIAQRLGYTEAWVSTVKSSPLFQALQDRLRDELRQSSVGGVVDRIVAEADASLDVIVQLRDGAPDDKVKLSAARDLLDRNPETAHVSKTEDRRDIKLSLDVTAMRLMATADAELDGRAPPVLNGIAHEEAPDGATIVARTVDEWLADHGELDDEHGPWMKREPR